VTLNITTAIDAYPQKKPTQNLALFSTYNTKCGIALYAKYLISEFKDEVTIFASKTTITTTQDGKNIFRCWLEGRETKDITELKQQLLEQKTTTLIIQYNFSFIPLHLLEELILFCNSNNIKTHLFLHSTQDVITKTYTDSLSTIATTLKKVTKIYIHTLEDINYLKDFNIYKITYLFTHGINTNIPQPKNHPKTPLPTLATFGFLLPQKGILELVDIVETLHTQNIKVNLLLLTAIHPAPISKQLATKLAQKINNSKVKNHITLNTNFLSDSEVLHQLSTADKLVFLYKETQESSSAAVRMGLLAKKEVITTPSKIFKDVKEVVTTTKDFSTPSIIQTIKTSPKTPYNTKKHQEFLEQNSSKSISQRFYNSL